MSRLTAAEVGEALARHEKECAERYGHILTRLEAMHGEIKPVLEVYRGTTFGGRVLVRLIAMIGAVSAIVLGWLKLKAGG